MSRIELSERAEDAMSSMDRWAWLKCDPDGEPFPPGIPLSDAVNRLALEGHEFPAQLLLVGLSSETLLARGSISWRKYHNFEHYQVEENYTQIPAFRWKRLAELIADSRERTGSGSWLEETVSLRELGMHECQRFNWNAQADWFSYCEISDEAEPWDNEYLEEWFSASDLIVLPARLSGGDMTDEDIAKAPPSPAKRTGGRRPANWWPAFAEELAIYIHEHGLPPGEGADGQDDMIADIFKQMNERGGQEGGRTTVQPVIRSILIRLREAGN